MDRREFLKNAGKVAALAAVAGEAGLMSVGCRSNEIPKTAIAKSNFEVATEKSAPKVVLAHNEDHAHALASALDSIGGIGRFVKKGERVLLKPNVAWDRVPEQAVNTNPVIVGEMVRQCLMAGASEVLVADYGSPEAQRIYERSGIRKAVEQNGGRLIITNDDDFFTDDLKGKFIGDWPVLKYIFEVDRLINMPIAKNHGLVHGTASMKNFFGAIGGIRDNLHDQLDQAIVDLASYFRPTLTVIDATRVLMRHGPEGGSFADVKKCDSVICATDQVAGDSRACEFHGRTGRDIGHIRLAAQQGLGEIDYRKAGYLEVV